MASAEVEAKPFPDDGLPTELQIYQHFLHLDKVKIKSGPTIYTPLLTKAKCVASSISEKWDKTQIPHLDWSGRREKRVECLITSIRLAKKAKEVDIYGKYGKLF